MELISEFGFYLAVSLSIGILVYQTIKKKNVLVSITIAILSFCAFALGDEVLFFAVVIMFIYFISQFMPNMKSAISNCVFIMALAIIANFFAIDTAISFTVLGLFSTFVIVKNNLPKNFILGVLAFTLSSIALMITKDVNVNLIIISILPLLAVDATPVSNENTKTVSEFKKYFLKKKVVNYKYLVISLYSDKVNKLTRSETKELTNFLDYARQGGLVIQFDTFSYAIAYSDIKKSFGTSVSKVNDEIDTLIVDAESEIKKRLIYPICSSTKMTYDFDTRTTEDFNKIDDLLEEMKEEQKRKTELMKKRMKGLSL